MPRSAITNDEARDLPHEELVARVESVLADYDWNGQPETEAERVARVSRTIEEMPEVYRWLLGLHSNFDFWTDKAAQLLGPKSPEYKTWRQRRDFFEKMASAAKQRYESASRLITVWTGFDVTGMPKQRK